MKLRLASVACLIAALGFLGCPQPSPKQPEPQPAVITDTESCGPACTVLMGLGCDEGMPIEVPIGDGGVRLATCGEVCRNTQDNGVWLNPQCVMKISSCSQVESCALKK